MRCPECGHVIRTEEKVCPRCQWTKDRASADKYRGPLPLIIAVAIGLAVGGGGMYVLQQRNAPRNTPTSNKTTQSTTPAMPLANGKFPVRTSSLPPGVKVPSANTANSLPPVIPQPSSAKVPPAPPKDLPQSAQIGMAAQQGDTAKVEKLLSADPTLLGAKGEFNLTPLHLAAREGKQAVVSLLLAKGAAVNEVSTGGYTPLHLAALHGYTNIADTLLKKGAEVNARDTDGKTPLELAASQGKTATITLLLNKGADLNAKDNTGFTPLHEATIKHFPEAVKLLKARGAKE